ncbi:MAG: 2-phosphosulfolactate [Planctomycetota bacterium]|nr:MAG: 2-phosphosulfolactate [Planctomycetota bacterium]
MPSAFPEVKIVEGLEGAASASGHVVIIDVLRAFTTAAYAFAAGAETIELVATPEEALARPGWRMGEVGGRLIPGFHHSNSPSQLAGKRVPPRVIQRTGAGTRCAVAAAPNAKSLWLASLVVVSATARALEGRSPVTLIVSGAPEEGEEDGACAVVLENLLTGKSPDFEKAVRDVRASRAAAKHAAGDPDRPIEDVDCAVAVDRFAFAIRAESEAGRTVARRVP